MLPNDPEINELKKRLKNGIPLEEETFKDLKKLSNEFNVKLQLIS